jgi:UBA/TS-N domain
VRYADDAGLIRWTCSSVSIGKMPWSEAEIALLTDNGLDRDAAIAALSVYGTAERVLLHHVCGEDVPVAPGQGAGDSEHEEATLGARYHRFLQKARKLSWTGVDVRKDPSAKQLCDTIVDMGAEFLRQAVNDDDIEDLKDQNQQAGSKRDKVDLEKEGFVISVKDEDIAAIMSLGFTREQSRDALVKMDGNIEPAVALLLDEGGD